MTTFAEFQQNAKQLARCLARTYGQHAGCLSFFSVFIPDNSAMDDASTIGMLAKSLDDTYDLLHYVKTIKRESKLSLDDFNQFRSNVIVGIYLVKWFQYNSIASGFIHKSLIDLFRSHLGVETFEEVNKDLFNSCLTDLSYYCSFVFEKRDEKTYANLNSRLGATIQKEIHETRNYNKDYSWSCLYKGIMSSIGMSMY